MYFFVYLQLHHLAVDALLKCNQVNEMEGGALLGFDHEFDSEAFSVDGQNSFDESTSCAHAFRVLKQLIQRCLADAVTSGNVFADAMLQHLYRWLCRFLLSSIAYHLLCDSYNYCILPTLQPSIKTSRSSSSPATPQGKQFFVESSCMILVMKFISYLHYLL